MSHPCSQCQRPVKTLDREKCQSCAAKGHVATEATRLARGIALKEAHARPETKIKHRRSVTGIRRSQEANRRNSRLRVSEYASGKMVVSPKVGKGKGGYYKGRWMRSRWERNFARILDFFDIKWLHEPKTFVLEIDGRKTTYRPDFYLPEKNVWIEVKGYFDSEAQAKWLAFIDVVNRQALLIDPIAYQWFRLRYRSAIADWEEG
jgi:hypothetical protein